MAKAKKKKASGGVLTAWHITALQKFCQKNDIEIPDEDNFDLLDFLRVVSTKYLGLIPTAFKIERNIGQLIEKEGKDSDQFGGSPACGAMVTTDMESCPYTGEPLGAGDDEDEEESDTADEESDDDADEDEAEEDEAEEDSDDEDEESEDEEDSDEEDVDEEDEKPKKKKAAKPEKKSKKVVDEDEDDEDLDDEEETDEADDEVDEEDEDEKPAKKSAKKKSKKVADEEEDEEVDEAEDEEESDDEDLEDSADEEEDEDEKPAKKKKGKVKLKAVEDEEEDEEETDEADDESEDEEDAAPKGKKRGKKNADAADKKDAREAKRKELEAKLPLFKKNPAKLENLGYRELLMVNSLLGNARPMGIGDKDEQVKAATKALLKFKVAGDTGADGKQPVKKKALKAAAEISKPKKKLRR